MGLRALVLTVNGRSRDFVDSRLLNLHLRLELPESGFADHLKEVHQVVAACWHAKMNVELLAHEIWILRLFWSDLSVQVMVVVHLKVCDAFFAKS